jgi:hypothetical protein
MTDKLLEAQLTSLMFPNVTKPQKRQAEAPAQAQNKSRRTAPKLTLAEREAHLAKIKGKADELAALLEATCSTDLSIAMAVTMDTLTEPVWKRHMTPESWALLEKEASRVEQTVRS